jgi:lipopolysaccharide biosynthesis glycosyltransferase
MINLFVGFDTREIVAHHVCINSIIRQSTQPLSITPLALNNLGQYSESHLDGSNQFVYSRFLVPHFMDYKGWALYIDGDMILRDDIVKLWNLRDDTKAVM